MKPIIVDLGSSSIKAGPNSQDAPKIVIPNYIGEVIDANKNNNQQTKYISLECDKNIESLKLYYPIKNGVFSNKDDIKDIFNIIYKNLDMTTPEIKSCPILISEPLMNSIKNKQNISEYLFESLEVPSLFFGTQPVLSLLGNSRITGVVLESGDKISQCCVVQEGYSLPNSFIRNDYGGSAVTDFLQYILYNKGYFLNNSSSYQLIKKLKEKYCSAKYDYFDEIITENKKYELPDGSFIPMGKEINQCSEVLFDPQVNNLNYIGLQHIVYDSLCQVDVDLRANLFGNILLSGGNTSMKDFPATLHKKIKEMVSKNLKVRLYTPCKPDFCCWNGGKAITSLEKFKNMWITKSEWSEIGEKIFKQKSI